MLVVHIPNPVDVSLQGQGFYVASHAATHPLDASAPPMCGSLLLVKERTAAAEVRTRATRPMRTPDLEDVKTFLPIGAVMGLSPALWFVWSVVADITAAVSPSSYFAINTWREKKGQP